MSNDKYGLDFKVWGNNPAKVEQSTPAPLRSLNSNSSSVSDNNTKNITSEDDNVENEVAPASSRTDCKCTLKNARFISDSTTTFHKPCKVTVEIESKEPPKTQVTFSLFAKYNDTDYDLQHQIKVDPSGNSANGELTLYTDVDGYVEPEKLDYFFKASTKGAKEIASAILTLPYRERISGEFLEVADLHFHHNCALPSLNENEDLADVLATVFSYAQANPAKVLIIEGHADRSGPSEYNFKLSKRRAQSIKSIIDNNKTLWNEIVDANGIDHKIETEDYQQTLKVLAGKYGWSCDPGVVDNISGTKTKAAVKNYQTEFNERFSSKDSLTIDGIFGSKSWKSLFFVLRDLLEKTLKNMALDPAQTISYGFPDGNGVYPCGESFPITGLEKSELDRRVELVFYKKTECSPVVTPVPGRSGNANQDPVTEKEWEKTPIPVVTPTTPPSGNLSSTITEIPLNFAPKIENCTIKYKVDSTSASSNGKVTVTIKNKQNMEIFKKTDLPYQTGTEHTYSWDGVMTGGNVVGPEHAPISISLSVTGSPTVCTPEKFVNIEIKAIVLSLSSVDASQRLIMNNQATTIDVTAIVQVKKQDGTVVPVETPVEVKFTFIDPGSANTPQANSYQYDPAPKHLGKTAGAGTLFWSQNNQCISRSTDNYQTSCYVKTIDTHGSADKGKAKVIFLPSAVGGDDFKIKAQVFANDGSTVLMEKESDSFTIWREANFTQVYEMTGTNHISTNATTAIIAPYFSPAYVSFAMGAVNTIAAANSVEYIGLWKDTATPQESWATMKTKIAAETPTADEMNDANYNGADPALVAKCTVARNAIIAKAQAWVNRIDTAYLRAIDKWVRDAGIPGNSVIGIKKYHPKYSSTTDTITSEWNLYGTGTPAWLRVTTYSGSYPNMDPDQIWVSGGGQFGGLSIGNGNFSVPDYVVSNIIKIICHEAGHATKQMFKRDDFGPSLDHSVSNAGIMYYTTAGGNNFTDREKNILRGIIP